MSIAREKIRQKTTVKKTTSLPISYWEKIRGLWKTNPVNGLAYQKKIRAQSDQRLKI